MASARSFTALGLAVALAGVAPALAASDLDALAPSELMARYQAECVGTTAESMLAETGGADPAAAFAHGTRCDALAEAIQALTLDDHRAGSADLARPDFYTPGSRAE